MRAHTRPWRGLVARVCYNPGMEQPITAVKSSPALLHRARLLTNLCFAILTAMVIATAGLNLAPAFDDSKQYRQGARNLEQVGDPYATTRPGDQDSIPYPNPPLLAYLLVPTLPLGEGGGRLAWFCLNLAAWVALVWLSLRIAGPPWARRHWGPLVFALALSPPTYLCLLYGQLGIMLALLLVLGFALASRHQSVAGATLAFAAAIKVYPSLPALYYLLRGPRRVLGWAAAVGAALLAVPLLFDGLRPYRSYLETVLLSDFYPYAAEFNVSLMGLWRRLLTETPRFEPLADAPGLALTLTLLTSLAVLAVCVRATDAPGELGALLAFSLWFCATLLLSPINGIYNLGGLVLPALAIARGLRVYPSAGLAAGYALATGLICTPQNWYTPWPALEMSLERGWGLVALVPPLLGLCGYVVILAALARRHRRWAANSGMLKEDSAGLSI
ncbi:MAG: DUF2029 domain-containing protein [Chloroflexales bacterium]|nr:DUF2029 domain-containing protein [Chloroflexales bacterium]